MDTPDPPCDFGAFVAQHRGITCEQAERLVESWIEHYCPHPRPAIPVSAEPNAEQGRFSELATIQLAEVSAKRSESWHRGLHARSPTAARSDLRQWIG